MNEKLRIGVIGCDGISWKASCPGIVAAKTLYVLWSATSMRNWQRSSLWSMCPVNLANRHTGT